jgi:hypothetical protein
MDANPFNPSWELTGGYWQWGRKNEAITGPASSNIPGDNLVVGWNTLVATKYYLE